MRFKYLCLSLAAALLLAASCGPKEPVVKYKLFYDWTEDHLPDFSQLGEPDLQGVKTNLDLEYLPDTVNHFAVLFETTLPVKTEEEYTFKLSTDDGSKFYVDGELLIDNDGKHGPILKKASKTLSKGKHDLRLEFFDYDKGQSIDFTYSTPTIPWQQLNPLRDVRAYQKACNDKFVKPQVEEALARYQAWKGADETVCYVILTDVHTAGRYSYKHVGFAAQAADAFGADFMVNLGDIGLNAYPATVDAAYAKSVVDNTVAEMKKYDGIWLYAVGNHDWDAGEGNFHSEQFLSDTFQKPWQEKAGDNLHLTPGKVYCYYDIPEKGLRVILLNSTGTGTQGGQYYVFDEPQMQWLEALLAETPADLDVLVMCHYMPHPLGRWTTSNPPDYTNEGNARVMGILADYVAKGRQLVGLVTGDAHVNMHAEQDGVNYFISQGYGWVVPDLMLPGTKHAFFDYTETLCIDVVAIKPATNEVHTFRIGAGGKDYDYVFNY
jgi:hypothetical protein